MNELTQVSVSGAVDIKSTNRFVTATFELDGSGPVDINLEIEAKSIHTELSGAGEIEYRGKTGKHRVPISGAGSVKAFDLVAVRYDLNISGSGDCPVHATQELNVHAR